jgi:Cu(I)/Ag(I) efflux system membrane fusion protein
MKKSGSYVLLVTGLIGAYSAGSLPTRGVALTSGYRSGSHVAYYRCPMHPEYIRDKPGYAPCCGMRLEPVYDHQLSRSQTEATTVPGNAVSRITPGRQQLMGVRVSAVERTERSYNVRLFGKVTADETRTYKITAGVDGWMGQVSSVTTGSRVSTGQVLATYSTADLFSSVQAYLFALTAGDRIQNSAETSPATSNMNQRLERLESLGMSRSQLEEIRSTRQFPAGIQVVAPGTGFVLARNVSPGQRFEKGMELYRIADLSRVWILVDVPGEYVPHIRAGQLARVTLPRESKTLQARVSELLPQFDGTARTMQVRLDVDNTGYALRPNMFVDAELAVNPPASIVVTSDAVLDSGLKKAVFVERGEDAFEERPVETGWRFGDQVQILSGLNEGERIATSGNFLLDSETRMKAEMSKQAAPARRSPH